MQLLAHLSHRSARSSLAAATRSQSREFDEVGDGLL